MMKTQPLKTYPQHVRATRAVTDEGRPCAEAGEIGHVLYGELREDGTRALTVDFPSAPVVTTCFIGHDVEPAWLS